MKTRTVLSGIKPTGQIHVGHYVSCIKPIIELQQQNNTSTLTMIADLHALTKSDQSFQERKECTNHIIAAFFACGIENNAQHHIYLQSRITPITELMWILSSVTPLALLKRAHAIKGLEDKDVSFGLFSYPVLMAADIIACQADEVLVGKDQAQHVEITRDIIDRMNQVYKVNLPLVNSKIIDEEMVLGTDGRKMSKSYDNTIPMFGTEDQIVKAVRKIVTSSTPSTHPKDPYTCNVFSIYKKLATLQQIRSLCVRYLNGISYNEAKDELIDVILKLFNTPRENYLYLIKNTDLLHNYVNLGAVPVLEKSKTLVHQLKLDLGFI